MEEFTIEVSLREKQGRSANNNYRAKGLIPSIMYHRGEESVPLVTDFKGFERAARKARPSQVFRFRSSDEILNGRSVIVREIQKEYERGKVLHIDYQLLKEDEEIQVSVILEMTGEAPGVKNEGGILQIVTHEIGVFCLPKDIPQSLTVDVSGLALGQSIHAKDVVLPAGVRLADDPEETLVSVVAVRATTEAAAEEASAEGQSGDAAKAASAGGKAAPAGKGGQSAAQKAPAKK